MSGSIAKQLYEGLKSGNRVSLAKAITLVESTTNHHKIQANLLMDMIAADNEKYNHGRHDNAGADLPGSATTIRKAPRSIRIGLSGSPGVGKSTFIESLGRHLTTVLQQHVAVLAVDPSSVRSGGSILGDKTRMTELSRDPLAYVRASPSGCSLGGVARNTHEAILICEAAGYDVILVETVGVGQSETMVSDMVDVFTLLVPPAGGDELQGIKKGIVELVDLVIVNKADGDLVNPARRAQIEYTSALKFLRPKNAVWTPSVISISSIQHSGIDQAWNKMKECHTALWKAGTLETLRSDQQKRWMWRILTENLLSKLTEDESINRLIEQKKAQVAAGTKAPGQAADEILDRFFQNHHTAAATGNP